MPHSLSDALVCAALTLRAAVERLRFNPPVTHVYNPLNYAWPAHEAYLRRFGNSRKRVVFLGMNPGPFGMAQTGVPFGEISAVRDWMGIEADISKPRREHPKRPIEGFACPRSEVSGKRLWGLFAERFGSAEKFFAEHFVVNFCPVAFLDKTGRNLTPDKLPGMATGALFALCDAHLRRVAEILQPHWLIGIGDFAEKRARLAANGAEVKVAKILHPSPASPAANRNWAGKATEQLCALGVWGT
ncbi:MAG: single-stranded DNA-binding protein [Verrucomicrobia bacterium]|nr:single-stranded DNA-binding protein [Verrucomicrobiota bacterium]